MKHRHATKPVRLIASILLVPTALASIPKEIKKQVVAFKEEVNEEVSSRKALVESI